MRGSIGVGLWESLWQACENLLSVDLKYVGHKWNSSMLARILHKTPLNMMNYKTAALPSGLIHWVDWHAITSLNAYRHKHMSDITTAVVRTWFCTVVSFLNKLCGLSLSPFPFFLPPLSLTYCTAKIHLLESVFSYYSAMEVHFHSITVHCYFKYLTFDNRNDFMALFPLSHFPTPPVFARSYQKGS